MSQDDGQAVFIESVRSCILDLLSDRVPIEDLPAIDEKTLLWDDSGNDSLELDSLDALDLIAMLEEAHDTVVPDDLDIGTIKTVGDVARVLSAAVGSRT